MFSNLWNRVSGSFNVPTLAAPASPAIERKQSDGSDEDFVVVRAGEISPLGSTHSGEYLFVPRIPIRISLPLGCRHFAHRALRARTYRSKRAERVSTKPALTESNELHQKVESRIQAVRTAHTQQLAVVQERNKLGPKSGRSRIERRRAARGAIFGSKSLSHKTVNHVHPKSTSARRNFQMNYARHT
eukprot:GILJ01000605.1.p1 GENE.GILJ01000605.1~~GILJ01000605.1.p1  ORF type:complete len:187 (+),score=9.35 GILJ01000605.1:108-668(+)